MRSRRRLPAARDGAPQLIGRGAELDRLHDVVAGLREGRGGALWIEGEPGLGKTALLDAAAPSDIPVLRSSAVESEAELAYAGLEELLQPLDDLPSLAHVDGATVVRAVAARLAEAAPVVLLVDDLQWLDAPSQVAIGYLARRARRLGIAVIGVWSLRGETPDDWSGVPSLRVEPLARDDALRVARTTGIADPVAERLVDAVGGNPLALVQAPASLTDGQRSGRELLPDPLPVGERLQRVFGERIVALPDDVREALLLKAAGAPDRLVAGRLGPAEDAGLVRRTDRVAFAHPFARSAAYHVAPPSARRAAHLQVAAAVDEPERTWQLAQAAEGPDEDLAARLEQLGYEALGRGAPGTAAAALERAARLSVTDEAADGRLRASAYGELAAGRPIRAGALLDEILPRQTDPLARAEVQLLRGMAMAEAGRVREALALLRAEAARVRDRDALRAAALLTEACVVNMGAGPLDVLSGMVEDVEALSPEEFGPMAAVMRAEVLVLQGRHDAGRTLLAELEPLIGDRDPTAPGYEILTLAALCVMWLGEDARAETMLRGLVDRVRETGATTPLAGPLAVLASVVERRGRLAEAAALADEALDMAEAGVATFGLTLALGSVSLSAALRGDEETVRTTTERMLAIGERLGQELTRIIALQARGELRLGRGEAQAAIPYLEEALARTRAYGVRDPAFLTTHADLVEALVLTGATRRARAVLDDLARGQALTGGAWAEAALARGRALLGHDADVDAHLATALGAHERIDMPFELARTRLVFGERLRRADRPDDARVLLEAARGAFSAMGATPWAARAASSLGDLSEAVRLTAREEQVRRLVVSGATNREVAAELVISERTVEHHLRQIYGKFGVRSRTELAARSLDLLRPQSGG